MKITKLSLAKTVARLKFLFCKLIYLLFLAGAPALAIAHGLTIPGTGESQALLRVLALEYANTNADRSISVPFAIGSDGGLRELGAGRVQLARTARPLEQSESPGLVEIEFARSPLVFATNDSVAVPTLSKAQLLGIYSGEITNWSELGGPDHEIYVLHREPGSSIRSTLDKQWSDFAGVQSVGSTVFSTPRVANIIRVKDFTIGYLPLSSALADGLSPIALDGVDPADKNYPLMSSFYLVYSGELQGRAQSFVGFLRSDAGAELLKEYGAVPVGGE